MGFYLDPTAKTVAKMAATSKANPMLSGLHIFPDGRVMGTDAYMVLEYQSEKEGQGQQVLFENLHTNIEKPLTISADEFISKQRFRKDKDIRGDLAIVRTSKADDLILIQSENTQVKHKNEYCMIEGAIPDYEKSFPKKLNLVGTFNAKLLQKLFNSIGKSGFPTIQVYHNEENGSLFVMNQKFRGAAMGLKDDDAEIFSNPNHKK